MKKQEQPARTLSPSPFAQPSPHSKHQAREAVFTEPAGLHSLSEFGLHLENLFFWGFNSSCPSAYSRSYLNWFMKAENQSSRPDASPLSLYSETSPKKLILSQTTVTDVLILTTLLHLPEAQVWNIMNTAPASQGITGQERKTVNKLQERAGQEYTRYEKVHTVGIQESKWQLCIKSRAGLSRKGVDSFNRSFTLQVFAKHVLSARHCMDTTVNICPGFWKTKWGAYDIKQSRG